MRKTMKQHTASASPKISPVASAVRQQVCSRHRQYIAAALVGGALAMPQQAPAQDLVLEEIVVTAQKRTENLQDVPIAITAFDNTAITEMGMQSFTDFALMVPNLSFKSFANPGGATLYMRGAADGGNGNPSGSAPSVAVYLDEQPVSSIGSNLDVHLYDMERIEALGGPQGTLYGASSQTGTVRYITNKPNPEAFEGGFDLQGYGMTDGDSSYSVEGFVNFPLGENAAIRLVGWYLEEGGWIDNVATDANTVAGPEQSVPGVYTYNLSLGRTFTLNNDAYVKDDQNELTKTGLRAALGVDLNENWTATASVFYQNMESEGVWEHAPDMVGERNVQRYSPDVYDDEFTQLGLTIEGEFANHSLVYAGAFMDREAFYEGGYHAYGGYQTGWVASGYACDYTATATDVNTDCTSLQEAATSPYTWDRSSHELRLLSLADSHLHYTVGVFYEKIEFAYELNFFQPGMSPIFWKDGINSLFFQTDQTRDDEQFALFGELTFDFSDSVSGTIGARYFENEGTVVGVVGWGNTPFGVNNNFVDSSFSEDDTIFKVNVTWTVNDDALVYATWSEGYRSGGINRDPVSLPPGSELWTPDTMTNYEIGWKTTLADGRVRFNGAAYFMEWEDLQYTVYQASLSACCGNVYNLSTAEITGLEFDLTALLSDGLTLTFAGAYNDAETTADFVLPSGLLSVPSGSPLPNVPEFKGTVFARYEFSLTSSLPAYAQLSWSYTGSSESEIVPANSVPQDSYSIGNLRAGVNKGSWGVDLFVNNVGDEVAQIYIHPRSYELTTVTNRPRTFGVKYWARFQ